MRVGKRMLQSRLKRVVMEVGEYIQLLLYLLLRGA